MSQIVTRKVKKIESDICAVYSEKITHALKHNIHNHIYYEQQMQFHQRRQKRLARAEQKKQLQQQQNKNTQVTTSTETPTTTTTTTTIDDNTVNEITENNQQQQQEQEQDNNNEVKETPPPVVVVVDETENKNSEQQPTNNNNSDDTNNKEQTDISTNSKQAHEEKDNAEDDDDDDDDDDDEEEQQTKLLLNDLDSFQVKVEFDWSSFNDLFHSLINEGAQEVIETILDSLISKDCAISLLSSLLSHCKEVETASNSSSSGGGGSSSFNTRQSFSGTNGGGVGGGGTGSSKREQIRSFLQNGLRRYVIKYSDNPRMMGYYDAKTRTLCDVVEIDVTDQEEINWIFRDVTKSIEKCTELQQYMIQNYYIPEYEQRIQSILQHRVSLVVHWDSIDYAAQDYARAVYTIYHDRSAMVLEEILRAFELLSVYEDDVLVDALPFGLRCVGIALQPGDIGTRKDFDIDEKNSSVTLRLCLEAAEYTGVFRANDLVQIFKLTGIYDTELTPIFKMDLLSSAAKTFNVARGDLNLFLQILNRDSLNWWNGTSESQRQFFNSINVETADKETKKRYDEYVESQEKEQFAIEQCVKFIEHYYKQRIESWNKQQRQRQQEQGTGGGGNGGGNDGGGDPQQQHQQQDSTLINEDDELHSEFEKLIKAWHVVKFNKQNLHQERFLLLTNRAYWTFKFDFIKKKVDDQHYKRHDLTEFHVCDIGDLEQTEQFSVKALKIFTREQRKKGKLGQKYQEVEATSTDPNKKRRKSTKLSLEYRKSLRVNTAYEDVPFSQQLQMMLSQQGEAKIRQKKKKPERPHPNVDGYYSSIFIPYGSKYSPKEIENILLEISWCIFAAATARMGVRNMMHNDGWLTTTQLCHEPFTNQKLTRPKGSLSSFFYNALAIGIMKKQKGLKRLKERDDDLSSSSASTPTQECFSPTLPSDSTDERTTTTVGSVQVIIYKKHRFNPQVPIKKKILKQQAAKAARTATFSIGTDSSDPLSDGTLSPSKGALINEDEHDSTPTRKNKSKRRLIFNEKVDVFYTGDASEEEDHFYLVEEALRDHFDDPAESQD